MCFAVPLSVCRPLCGSSAERAEVPAGFSAGVSPPSPSPGAKTGLNTHAQTGKDVALHHNLSCDLAAHAHAKTRLALVLMWDMKRQV